MMGTPLPPGSKSDLRGRDVLDAVLRSDFPSFIHRCFLSLTPGTPFLPNWHIDALAFCLEQVRQGRIKRLIICMPPRSLKSMVTSVAFPAYMLGHDPTKRLITVSYAADLAVKHAGDFRAILRTDWYRRLFAGTRISQTKNTETEVVTTLHGFRLSTSIDGTLTGRGGDLIIIDDPLKPSDALSDTKRERVNAWYDNTLISRLDNKMTGAIVIVMQRLHLNDLVGTLLQNPDEWTVLNLPAIAEQDERIQIGENRYYERRDGDVLHAERESLSVLEAIKAQLGSDTFAAQYQQQPVPPGGAMIKRIWVRRYTELPSRTRSQVFQSWDSASKEGSTNDWSVCTTWMLHDRRLYLIDVLRGRFDYPTLKAHAIAHAQVHKPYKILVEDAGVGTALITELKRSGCPAIGIKPKGGKIERMSVESAKFEAGQVFLPERAPWLADLEAELFAFPHARHDDQVDSISQALANATGGYDSTLSWVG